jgi:hypothetical protein
MRATRSPSGIWRASPTGFVRLININEKGVNFQSGTLPFRSEPEVAAPMPVIASADLTAELEGTVRCGWPARRVWILRQITGLFVAGADGLKHYQVGIFDFAAKFVLTDHSFARAGVAS